jgi:RNA polymerase sigma factor (sigma-70 family)
VLQLMNHLGASYNLAKWLTQNEQDAEDIVQDAYLRATQHFGNFRGGDGRAWLLTIVRNLCYDAMRRKNVREGIASFDEEQHYTCPTTGPDPESALLHKERADVLRRALGELPLELREVLVLREIEELSYREIACIAQIPIGTVMSRLSRARKRLQDVLLPPENAAATISPDPPASR